jgi:hypothetical protein
MPEQTFRSPNFYEREIDLSAPTAAAPSGTPAGIIGTAHKGPAFVPVTVGNFDEFVAKFGNLDPKKFGPYAVNEFLKHRSALTYLRVLGAGANNTATQIETTRTKGRVNGAGFYLDGVAAPGDSIGRHAGTVQLLVATHNAVADEVYGIPLFTDNDSISSANTARLVRGVLLTPNTARVLITSGTVSTPIQFSSALDEMTVSSTLFDGKFKILISSSLGNTFANTDGYTGVKILTASFDPSSADYFGKILNTDPDKFVTEQHLLYADFPVDAELAPVEGAVAILSGSALTSTTSGDTALPFRKAFGAFDTRYQTPKTPWFISQPYGTTEYDLFKFEALDDGEYANTLYKVAISNIKASVNDADKYGTFTVEIRDWNDTDINPLVLESFPNCTLNPASDNYVGKLVGDIKTYFDFDATQDTERRLITTGKYTNMSRYVRIVMNDAVERALVPADCLPFGFRGVELLKTNDLLSDSDPGASARITGNVTTAAVKGAILPPIPFRVKVTKGEIPTSPSWLGQPGNNEVPLSLYYWGVKFERNTSPKNPNVASEKNLLLSNYTKFLGISKLDTLTTGSGCDTVNNNKFTLAKVALANTSTAQLTGSVSQHMREAAYIRNGVLEYTDYTINDTIGNRLTLASLLRKLSAAEFNKFSPYTKFVTFMYGGWDGMNILDRDAKRMNDKASSFDTGGGANSSFTSPGYSVNFAGTGQNNSTVSSYRTAVDIMTDPLTVNNNILAVPGIRESFLTDYTMKKVRDYGLAYYVMDIPAYDDDQARLYDDSTARPSITQTTTVFDARSIDNNYAGTYFPDVVIDDATNRRRVKVPSSVAALGALAFNDKVAYPWFAPAGFNRAALDFVNNVGVRLSVNDRDRLYDSRINPIATFPRLGYVIYGQKTLQINRSALDRVNVRRLLLEVKRTIVSIAQRLVFEQNTPEVRNRFVADASLQLALIQSQAGVEAFQVVMNETNNTQEDVDLNRLNGRIVVVPTRVIEYIAIDFIITNSGVQFV